MTEGYIKIDRKILGWEWYDDANTMRIFLHCLLKANWKAAKWHGITIEPGQFVTSLPRLAEETQLSVHQVRTALEHLKTTGEVADKGHSKFRIITVIKWNEYQVERQTSDRQVADKGQSSGRQVATIEEYKEREERKEGKNIKHIYGEYSHVRLTDQERDRLFDEYGEAETLKAIKFLDEYIQMKGYKAKDHNLALRKWVFKAVKEQEDKQKPQEQSVFDMWRNA